MAYVLLVEEKLEKKDQQKGKEIREDGVEEAEGIENRAVVDGVERRDGFGLPVDDRLRSLMSVVSSQFSPQKLTEELPSNLHSVSFSSLLLDSKSLWPSLSGL